MFQTLIRLWDPVIETAEQRRSFVYRTFIILGLFSVLALAQWLPPMFFPRYELRDTRNSNHRLPPLQIDHAESGEKS